MTESKMYVAQTAPMVVRSQVPYFYHHAVHVDTLMLTSWKVEKENKKEKKERKKESKKERKKEKERKDGVTDGLNIF